MSEHNWIKSQLGHGEAMCSRCYMTNREAAVLGRLNECPVSIDIATDGEDLAPASPSQATRKDTP